MKKVTIIYHEEQGSWWAESPDDPSFFATGENLDVVRARVYEYLPDLVGLPINVFSEVEIRAPGPSLTAIDEHDRAWRFGGLRLPGTPVAETC